MLQEMTERANILVADDDAISRDLLRESLSIEEFKVATAVNGLDALEKVRNNCFDLLVTDFFMPLLDGLSLIVEAKRVTPEIGIIMVTGSRDEIILLGALKKGAHAVIHKPFTHIDLLNIVHQILKDKNCLKIKKGERQR